MSNTFILCASVGLAGGLAVLTGKRPLLKLQRGITLLRAAGYLAAECADGAKARLSRWPECRARAERE